MIKLELKRERTEDLSAETISIKSAVVGRGEEILIELTAGIMEVLAAICHGDEGQYYMLAEALGHMILTPYLYKPVLERKQGSEIGMEISLTPFPEE